MDIAIERDFLIGIAPAVVGLAVVALLIYAVFYGRRRREREPAPGQDPQLRSGAWETPEEHGRGTPPLPGSEHGPGHQDTVPRPPEESGVREPYEVPRDGRRHLPHEFPGFGNMGTRPGARKRSTWGPEARKQ